MIPGANISNNKINEATPMLERKYSILAPAVFKESPTTLPTSGIICPTSILAVFVVNVSAFEDIRFCVEITVVNTIITKPTKNVNVFLIVELNDIRFTSLMNTEAIVNEMHTPIIISSASIHIFSKMLKNTIKP